MDSPGGSAEAQAAVEVRAKLYTALMALGTRIPASHIACCQVWRPVRQQQQQQQKLGAAGGGGASAGAAATPADPLQRLLVADQELFLLGDATFAPFRISSCSALQYGHQGMPGRVLKSGNVQVIQNLRIIPDVLHPRSRLPDGLAGRVGEVVYVPVFDLARPYAGPVAVLEALLSAGATDSMLVANFISVAGQLLAALQLSLSSPLPQPVRRSRLEGRKPRPVHPDSSPDLAGEGAAAAQQQQQQQQQQLQRQPSAEAACMVPVKQQAAAAAAHAEPQQQQQQQSSGTHFAPLTPASSEMSDGRQASPASTSANSGSAASIAAVAAACAGIGGGSVEADSGAPDGQQGGAAAAAAAVASMPPPLPAGCRSRQRPRWEQADDELATDDGVDDAGCRPRKLQRTLSLSRTKSVPLGLDQVLQRAAAEAAGTPAAAPEVAGQPAASC